jgi:LmbE family N-acetylglucosaminyl deacetylase
MKLPFKKALVLAPHTDDGEFGCGATISRLVREGCEVKYVAFSDCKESVPAGYDLDVLGREMMKATAVLGINSENVELLDYKVRYFGQERQRILEDLVRIGRAYNPDVVFTPSTMDIHQDHSTVTNEAIRAFKSKTILGYELPWNNLQLPSDGIITINSDDLQNKIMAIGKYESQLGRAYSNSDFIKSMAITRGTRIREEFAEAFEVIRLILR